MAAGVFGGEVSVTGTAQTLTTLLSLSANKFFSHCALRGWKGNTDTVYIGKSNVTTSANRLGFIEAREAVDISLEGIFTSTDEVWLIAGTPPQLVMVFGIA